MTDFDTSSTNTKQMIIQTARAMVDGSLGIVAGSRRICALRHEINLSDSELFHTFVAFDSDTDIYPIGADRAWYEPKYLLQLDREMEEIVNLSRSDVLDACMRIIESLG